MDAPRASKARPPAFLGISLTASHGSARLSCTGSIAGTLSGEGTVMLFRCTLGMAESVGGRVSTLLSVEGGIGVDWDWLE